VAASVIRILLVLILLGYHLSHDLDHLLHSFLIAVTVTVSVYLPTCIRPEFLATYAK
jgi:hypothetical protein